MNTYIIDAIRTPFGNFGGTLQDVRTDDLGAIPIRELVKRTGIDASKIDDVILGCANQAGEDNRNVARMSLLLAGLPFTVPGETVNQQVVRTFALHYGCLLLLDWRNLKSHHQFY